jgi:hypothetical protein
MCLALLLIPLTVLRGGAQNHPLGAQTLGGRSGGIQHGENTGGVDSAGGGDPFSYERRLRVINADRQRAMVSDAAKLLQLVTELNAEIERERPESLTPSQMRKLSNIEKLARNVKEKMKTSLGMPNLSSGMAPVAFP